MRTSLNRTALSRTALSRTAPATPTNPTTSPAASLTTRRAGLLALAAVAGLAAAPSLASGQALRGVAFRSPTFSGPTSLYTVDPDTGEASEAVALGTDVVTGIAFDPDGVLYGLTDEFAAVNGTPVDGGLITIDPGTGATTLVGDVAPLPLGFTMNEGDIDFQPATGALYGTSSNNGAAIVFTIDPATAAATLVGQVPGNNLDLSGLAFDADGRLWALDTSFDFNPATRFARLLELDPATGQILSAVELSGDLGTVGGIDFEPGTGTLYVADGDFAGTDALYTLDTATGVLTLVGPTGLDGGASGFGGLADIEFVNPCPADLAAPFGTLDLADVQAFVNAFTGQDAIADLAPPFGTLDLADVQFFAASFLSGCP